MRYWFSILCWIISFGALYEIGTAYTLFPRSPEITPKVGASEKIAQQDSKLTKTFTPPALTKFSSVVERPLFNRTRRPYTEPPAPKPVSPAAPTPPHLRLTAVSISGSKKTAILTDNKNQIVRLQEKQTLEGWTVKFIASDRVVIEKQGHISVIPFKTNP